MSTDYRSLADIAATDLFDGRLEDFGVRECFSDETTEQRRGLTDGHNYLWVNITDGLVSDFTRYAPNGAPGKILKAIAESFDVEVVSEHEPQFWGFDTQEDWDAYQEGIHQQYEEEFHQELLKFLNGAPHNIKAGTIGMCKAEIAKNLVEEEPVLRLRANKNKLLDAIQARYDRGDAIVISFGPEERAVAEMIATHEDHLAKV
jgi:hypothetical protein